MNDDRDDARRIVDVLHALQKQTRPGRGAGTRITGSTRLAEDLGLDSLARAELMTRLQREFGVDLPDSAVEANTPEELLQAVDTARGRSADASAASAFAPPDAVSGTPEGAGTLLEVLQWHVDAHPERVHLYLYGEDSEPQPITHEELHRDGERAAAGLRRLGVAPGDRVALMLPTGRAYFASWVGTLMAGAAPVPIYPPARPSQLEEHLRRHGRILTNAGAAVLVTVPEARQVSRLLRAEAPQLKHIVTLDDLDDGSTDGISAPRSDDLAMLQYTSGSTGDPKGVTLTHAQLLANVRAMGERGRASSTDVFVSWLPLYHDMGLIGAWMGSLYYGMPLVAMSPLSFLANPTRWLRTIDRHGGTISGSPNFGYELCLRSVPDEALETLDLSSWRLAFNGAEPVNPNTLKRFAERFAPCGLRREALTPVYGLAEAAVGLTIPEPGTGAVIDTVERDAFMYEGHARPVDNESAGTTLSFVCCGPPLPGYELRILDPHGREVPERREGDLEFRGPSATGGYFNNDAATEGLLHDGWRRTGDRGYLADGELYLSGRTKDVIFCAGRNVYPYDVEERVGSLEGVRKGCVAVFGCSDQRSGTERVIVVAETRERDDEAQQALRERIEAEAGELLGITPADVRLVPPHAVLKTSSGKIRRPATRELYLKGGLERGASAPWWQVTRLIAATAAGRLRYRAGSVLQGLWAAWAWTVAALVVTLMVLVTLLLPGHRARWTANRLLLRAGAPLVGIRLRCRGLEHVPDDGAFVFVVNHTSYLDVPLLMSAIRRPLRFIAKKEFARNWITRVSMQRMGVVFVDRDDTRSAIDDAGGIVDLLQRGDPFAFFPEGTFVSRAGVRGFHTGAFVAAAKQRVAVVPAALSGVRSLLRADSWMPRPGRAELTVGEPVTTGTDDDWSAALDLRDRARAFIVTHSGEPDLEARADGRDAADTSTHEHKPDRAEAPKRD